MNKKTKFNASILIIGNEILSGRTKDTNTSTLALWLSSIGVKVEEVRVIPDDEKVIINSVREMKSKYNYVFTSGGIGPTHDDITAESIAKAFNLKYEIHDGGGTCWPGLLAGSSGRVFELWEPASAELPLWWFFSLLTLLEPYSESLLGKNVTGEGENFGYKMCN